MVAFSVTRLGDLLDFGQLCKAFGNNSYAIFVKASKSFIFLVKPFLSNFYRHLANFIWSHWWHCQFANLRIPWIPVTTTTTTYNVLNRKTLYECVDIVVNEIEKKKQDVARSVKKKKTAKVIQFVLKGINSHFFLCITFTLNNKSRRGMWLWLSW